jgi:hypothetical protein
LPITVVLHSKARETVGDYLVSVKSALGEHENPDYQLNIPQDRKTVLYGVDHMQLQYSQRVIDYVLLWLMPEPKQTLNTAQAFLEETVMAS